MCDGKRISPEVPGAYMSYGKRLTINVLPETNIDKGGNTDDTRGMDVVPLIDAVDNFFVGTFSKR